MKKAKIILSAVAAFAVVGGAFAFKAQRFLPANIYTVTTTQAGGPTVCTLTGFVTTQAGQGVISNVYTTNLCNALVQRTITTANE